jgi:hypothetical protein
MLELVSETVDHPIDLDALHDALASMLARAYREGALKGLDAR